MQTMKNAVKYDYCRHGMLSKNATIMTTDNIPVIPHRSTNFKHTTRCQIHALLKQVMF